MDERTQPEQSPLLDRNNSREIATYTEVDELPAAERHASSDVDKSPRAEWYNKPSIFWLLPAFLPFSLAVGGVVVPKTYLILDLLCSAHPDNPNAPATLAGLLRANQITQCRSASVQAEAARFQLCLNLITGVFAAIVTPHFGALSDRMGRKKVILMASLGGVVMETITILVAKYPERMSMNWLFLGALTDGLCGSFNNGMALAFAYASDCTRPDKRNIAFGYFHGVLFTGIALGPVVAGYIIQQTGDHVYCFYMAIGCHVFFLLFILGFTPESLSEERQQTARQAWIAEGSGPQQDSWVTYISIQKFLEPLAILLPNGSEGTLVRRNLFLLAAIDTVMFGVAMSSTQMILIYAEYRFGWSELDSTAFLSITNIVRVLGLVVLLPLLQVLLSRRISTHRPPSQPKCPNTFEIGVIRATTLLNLVGYIAYAFAPTSHILVAASMVISLGGMGSPCLQSAIINIVPSNSAGKIFGTMGSLHAAARVVTPTVLNLIYSSTVSTYAGTTFLCLAGLFVLASVMSFLLKSEGEPRAAKDRNDTDN